MSRLFDRLAPLGDPADRTAESLQWLSGVLSGVGLLPERVLLC